MFLENILSNKMVIYNHAIVIYMYIQNNKATRSPEISRQQVQKLTPQFFVFVIYIGYRFPLSLYTIYFFIPRIYLFWKCWKLHKMQEKYDPPPPPPQTTPTFDVSKIRTRE